MMKAVKTAWKLNFETFKFEPCAVAEEARAQIQKPYRHIPCAKCGKDIEYAKSWASCQILDENCVGYCLCQECWRAEMQEMHDAHLKIAGVPTIESTT